MRFIIRATFGIVPVGGIFQLQKTIKGAGDLTPITWLKVSTRTARVNGNGAVFYFGKADTVWLEEGVLVKPTNKEKRDV
jgi:hypothetical protein